MRANGLKGGKCGEIDIGGGEVKGNGEENWNGGGRGWNRAEKAGQGICHHVFGTRDVDYITGELGDVG